MNRRSTFKDATSPGLGLATTLLLLCSGCATTYPEIPHEYILQFDGRGQPVETAIKEPLTETAEAEAAKIVAEEDDPPPAGAVQAPEGETVPYFRGQTEPLSEPEVQMYTEQVLDGLEEFARRNCGPGEPCEILFFIHGGLTSNSQAVERVLELVCDNDYLEEPCDREGPLVAGGERYPIFVIWNSSLLSSYKDHLLNVQRGREIGPVGVLGAPFKLLADSGRALARAFIVDYEMVSHDLRTTSNRARLRRVVERDAEGYYKRLEKAQKTDPAANSRVTRCYSEVGPGQQAQAFFSYLTGFPVKLVASPFIDALGTVSWDIMLRRTELLFSREVTCVEKPETCDYELFPEPPFSRIRQGGLARFLDRFERQIEPQSGSPDWKITLIGHSMGAIIVNKILQRYPELPVKNVVYMASAARVGETQDSVWPLLERDPEARVFNLVLSPVAELRERFDKTDWVVTDLAPRGSLLVWIDNFLSKPNTLEDRTAGRFTNITRSIAATPPALKPRVHLTVFGVGKEVGEAQPQKHGEFASPERPFWTEDFWFPNFDDKPHCQTRQEYEPDLDP